MNPLAAGRPTTRSGRRSCRPRLVIIIIIIIIIITTISIIIIIIIIINIIIIIIIIILIIIIIIIVIIEIIIIFIEGPGRSPRAGRATDHDVPPLRLVVNLLQPLQALGVLACAVCTWATCALFTLTLMGCAIGPPALTALHVWAGFVWLAHALDECDQPLDAWLGVYLAYIFLMTCWRPLVVRACCRWSAAGGGPPPRRVKLLFMLGPVLPLAWMLAGRGLLERAATCRETSPALFAFFDWFSRVAVACHGSLLLCQGAWLVASLGAVPLLLWLARQGPVFRMLLWLLGRGLLQPWQRSSAARPDALEEMEVVEYRPELFADPSVPDDPRPQGECCICLQQYDASAAIRKTPCGHMMHHDCLGMWLRAAHTCPTCRIV